MLSFKSPHDPIIFFVFSSTDAGPVTPSSPKLPHSANSMTSPMGHLTVRYQLTSIPDTPSPGPDTKSPNNTTPAEKSMFRMAFIYVYSKYLFLIVHINYSYLTYHF